MHNYIIEGIKSLMDVNHLKDLQFQGTSVVVCTDLSDKTPHRQLGVDGEIVEVLALE